MQEIQIIESLVARGELREAVDALTELMGRDADADGGLHFLRGKLYWRMGDRAAAMNDYTAALDINPSLTAASTALAQARDIAAFFNPDLYNP